MEVSTQWLQSVPEGSIFNDYQYLPFPEDGKSYIRVAEIHPGDFEEVVYITLRREKFDSAHKPRYEALSYVWGSPEEHPARIIVEDKQDGPLSGSSFAPGSLPVRTNLLCALRHLRSKDGQRDVWIDAICIDQGDDIAKGPQVAMMGDIYAKAARVIVWLGPAADNSDHAMNIMRYLGSQIMVDWVDYAVLPSQGAPASTIADLDSVLPCDSVDLCALSHLFNRDWFDRLWIRQEIFLADQEAAIVLCGRTTVPWGLFRSAWLVIRRKPYKMLAQQLENRLSLLNGFLYQYPEAYLHTLRQEFAQASCQEPRDRIYAIQGLLPDSLQANIKPDYGKPLMDVHRQAMLAYLDSVRDLDILGQCQLSETWTGPSWVPDWSSNEHHPELPLDLRMASGMIKSPWEVMDTVGVLRVAGKAVATVSELKPLLPLPALANDYKSIATVISTLFREDTRSFSDEYVAGGTILDAYTRTLCDDVFRDNHHVPTGRQFPYYNDVKVEMARLKLSAIQQQPIEDAEFEKLRRRIAYSCSSRLLMRTQEGLIGLAPQPANQGDQVYVLLGSRKLLLLRPLSGSRYFVVGECSLCGFSHGEAILGPLPEDIRPIWVPVNDGRYAEVFENCRTGSRQREDPRLRSLGFDTADYREKLRTELRPYLEIDFEDLQFCLSSQGIYIQDVRLL
ncbi:heterokaryon incompatibility protein-domain-containing protein [Hypoxylon fuscum]|nr:heterokaryon incompatibility protein-domain-containing protein [Hypoxylon fuscum]